MTNIFGSTKIFLAMAGTVGVLAWSNPVVSAPNEASDARVLYDRGAAAYREARYDEAVELMESAYRMEPYADLAYDLARSREATGDLGGAIAGYREYLRLAPSAEDRAVIETRIRNLSRSEAVLRPRLTITSSPDGATLSIDDGVVGSTPWNGALAVGKHWVEARRQGHRVVRRELKVSDGNSLEVHLELPPVRPATEVSVSPPPRAKIAWFTWATLGVGAGALAGALAFELARQSEQEAAADAPTQLGHLQHYENAERLRDFGRGFLAVGAVAAAAGGVMLYLDLAGGGTRRLSTGMAGMPSVAVRADSVSLVGSGRF